MIDFPEQVASKLVTKTHSFLAVPRLWLRTTKTKQNSTTFRARLQKLS